MIGNKLKGHLLAQGKRPAVKDGKYVVLPQHLVVWRPKQQRKIFVQCRRSRGKTKVPSADTFASDGHILRPMLSTDRRSAPLRF